MMRNLMYSNLIHFYVNAIANIMCKYKNFVDLQYLPFILRSFLSLGCKYRLFFVHVTEAHIQTTEFN